MNRHLVLAGNHQQYLNWLATNGLSPADYLPCDEVVARGCGAHEIVSLDQVGTYWDNPIWGGTFYNDLMARGLALDLPWALPWNADFLRAEAMRDRRAAEPVTDAEAAAAIVSQADIEALFADE